MTETVGFYCPTCASKYVQYVCKLGLPCGHNPKKAVWVYAKIYGSTGNETVKLVGHGIQFRACGPPDEIEQKLSKPLIEDGWLPQFDGTILAFQDAFASRWESFKSFKYVGKQIEVNADAEGHFEFIDKTQEGLPRER